MKPKWMWGIWAALGGLVILNSMKNNKTAVPASAAAAGLRLIPKITDQFQKFGIKNKFSQAAALAVIGKESAFVPAREKGYGGTSVARIRTIFGARLAQYSDAQLEALKRDDVRFFNAVYGGRFGNGPAEGYRYRGGGFNQITFKANYANVGKAIGIDLVANPDALNDADTAARAALFYFQDAFKKAGIDINSPKTLSAATMLFYRANAGFGKPVEAIKADPTGGLAKAHALAPIFLKSITT